jgi:hypothetical protein
MEQRENAGYDLLVNERCAGRRSRAVQTAPGRPAPARGPFFLDVDAFGAGRIRPLADSQQATVGF